MKEFIAFDIETAAEYERLDLASADYQKRWQKLCAQRYETELAWAPAHELYAQKAALYPEFGRIVCLSFYHQNEIRSFSGGDEKTVVDKICLLFNRWGRRPIVGHNISRFDIPFIVVRALKYGLPCPTPFQFWNTKPWENGHIVDTLPAYRLGQYSTCQAGDLDNIAAILGVKSPKSEMDGSKVSEAFWSGRIEDITRYCEADVRAQTEVFNIFRQRKLITTL